MGRTILHESQLGQILDLTNLKGEITAARGGKPALKDKVEVSALETAPEIVSYQFDAQGRVEKEIMTSPVSQTTTLTYDANGRVSTAVVEIPQQTQWTVSMTYDTATGHMKARGVTTKAWNGSAFV